MQTAYAAYKNGDYLCGSCWNNPDVKKSWFKPAEVKRGKGGSAYCPVCNSRLRQRNRSIYKTEEEIKYAA